MPRVLRSATWLFLAEALILMGAQKLATAWCAEDQQTTLTELKAGVELPVNDCADNPIAAQYQLGQDMGVSGTPAIVTSSGLMVPGYRPADDLAALLGT